MLNLPLNLKAKEMGEHQNELRAVWVFILVTLILSVGVLFMLPGLGGPAIIVFIPTSMAVILIRLTAGKDQARRRLFSHEQWHLSLKWLLISLGMVLALRVGVSLAGNGRPR